MIGLSEMCIPAFSLWCNKKIEQILFLFFFHHNINLHAIKLHRKQSISLTFTKRKKKEKQEEKIWQKFVYYFQNIIFLTMLSGWCKMNNRVNKAFMFVRHCLLSRCLPEKERELQLFISTVITRAVKPGRLSHRAAAASSTVS